LIVHLLVTRRWIESHRIPGDLAVAFFVLVSIFTASIAADVVALPDTRTFDGRFQGLYNNPNMLGMMCLLALPIGWGLYAHTRRKRYLLGLIPTALAVLMSQSRTGIIAIGLGALWILLRKGPRAISQAIGVLAVGAVLIEVVGMRRQASALVDPISSRFADNQGDVFNGRMLGWRDSLQLLQARPTTGYGYAAGPTLFENSRATGVVSFSLDVVHNSYLQWLLELGAVGLVPLLALLFVCVWAVLRGDLGGIGAGLVWAIVAGLLLQTTESAMFGTGQTYPFVFWLVVAGALVRTATKIPPPEPSAGHRIGQESHGHHGETLAGRPL
jgi:O-antigen ligase